MIADDDLPKPKPEFEIGGKLEALSIADLELRVVTLKVEIERVEAELGRRRAGSAAAHALFRD